MKYLILFLACVIISGPAYAGVPYTTSKRGMAFLNKEAAQSFYTLATEGDKQAQFELLSACISLKTCKVVQPGMEVFLDEQAEYPLVLIRFKGSPRKYWALNNILGMEK